MKVTIKDVAKEADVATSTVSRVLSNNPRISETTRKRVKEAIDNLIILSTSHKNNSIN